MDEFQILGLAASRLKSRENEQYSRFVISFKGASAELFEIVSDVRRVPLEFRALSARGVLSSAENDLRRWSAEGISALALGQSVYPAALAQILKPPTILFTRGNFPRDFEQTTAIAIVGSRKADVEGERIGTEFARNLAARGVCVVSGLALGLDAAAHRGALQCGRKFCTIAVLGNGLGTVYPPANRKLAQQILEQGSLLLSQFEPDEKPYPGNFLNRNRIIAALSKAVLVVQAGEKSGSLVTARYALELGKEVFVVPGSILSQRYSGSNRLIQQGAAPALRPEDLYEILPKEEQLVSPEEQSSAAGGHRSSLQAKILGMLKQHEILSIDQIAMKMGTQISLASELLQLELQGLIERRPGNLLALKTRL